MSGGFVVVGSESAEDRVDDAITAVPHEGERFFGLGADTSEEPGTNQRASAVKTNLDVLLSEFEGLGGFRSAEFFEIAQYQYAAELLRETQNRVFQQMPQLRGGCALLGVQRRLHDVDGGAAVFDEIQLVETAAAPHASQGFMNGDAGKPGGKRREP